MGLLPLACLPVRAQVTTATIFGTVGDRTGQAIGGAEVTVTDTQTGFSRAARSQANGAYLINALPLGSYEITAAFPGFKKYVRAAITLDVNRRARVDVTLELGQVSDSVTVYADAPLVNTADAQLGRTVTNVEIVNLPLVNREVYALLNLTAGVEMNVTANTVGFRQTTAAINGSADAGAGSVAYYLDGGVNMTGLRNTGNATPNPDSVQEFRVITNGYSAEFGRFAAGVVDVVTKSGTNAFHGSLFEFLRNDKLNANDWSVLRKPPQRRDQFGGGGGGPVRKNRLFLFGSYSGLRQRMQDILTGAVVPSAAERSGDFSASAVKPSGAGIVNGVIPASALDPTAMRIINEYIPRANLAGSRWQGTIPRPSGSDDGNFKVDYTGFAQHQMALSWFLTKGFEYQKSGGNVPWSQQDYNWTQQNYNFGDTWVIGSRTIHQFHVTYVRNFGGRLNLPDLSLADLGSNFTIQGVKSLPQITVSGYLNLFEAIQGPIAGSNYYGVRDSLSLVRNRHSLKLGVEAGLEKAVQDTSLNNYGVWGFDGLKSGNALADFEMGLPASFKQDAPITKVDNSWYTGLFVQDDFHVNSRLTVNLGLRYELPGVVTDPHNRKVTFAPGVQSAVAPNAPAGLLFPGDAGVSRGIVRAPRTLFGPRAGFAWDQSGSGRTIVRAGAGIYYGSISANNMNMTADFQPFAARQTFARVKTLSDPYGNLPGGSPFPISYDPANVKFAFFPADVSTLAQNFRFPSTYQMSFSVEQRLAENVAVSAAYVSALGRHLPFTIDRNYPVWSPGATTGNLPSRRPYLPGTLGIINYEDGIISSSYHGLQTTIRKRTSRGLTLQANYTFSKSLEGAQTQNSTPAAGAEDFQNLGLERGRTTNDHRHTFSLSAVWQIDYVKRSRWAARVLNGWSLSFIATARSGPPLTCMSGQDNNVDGYSTDRCDVLGAPGLSPDRPRGQVVRGWFNTATFRAPVAGTDGNSGRDAFDAPGQKQLDMALFRRFRATEAVRLELRAEMSNALNLVNLSPPNTTLNSPAFGTITSAGPMRQSQLGVKVLW